MRVVALSLALALSGCAQDASVDLSGVPACATYEPSRGEFQAGDCTLDANSEALHVRFAALPEGAAGGVVSVDVLGVDGGVRQVLLEENVSEYITPNIQDVDGDGRGDILIPREGGNVNVARAVWIFTDEGLYRRTGEVSGVQIGRTEEGLIAVPARAGAASWNVAFHRLNGDGLTLIASVNVEGEVRRDGAISVRCESADAPGLALLNLTAADAETKFCAEPIAAGVFGP